MEFIRKLPENYPTVITSEQAAVRFQQLLLTELTQFGQGVLTKTVSSFFSFISIAVFIVLTPILVFFMLKDKKIITGWFSNFIPQRLKTNTFDLG